jgi:hypothetical protein
MVFEKNRKYETIYSKYSYCRGLKVYFVDRMLISCKDHSSSIQTCSTFFVNLARSSNRKANFWKRSFEWFGSLHSRRVIEIKSRYKITSLKKILNSDASHAIVINSISNKKSAVI